MVFIPPSTKQRAETGGRLFFTDALLLGLLLLLRGGGAAGRAGRSNGHLTEDLHGVAEAGLQLVGEVALLLADARQELRVVFRDGLLDGSIHVQAALEDERDGLLVGASEQRVGRLGGDP